MTFLANLLFIWFSLAAGLYLFLLALVLLITLSFAVTSFKRPNFAMLKWAIMLTPEIIRAAVLIIFLYALFLTFTLPGDDPSLWRHFFG